MITLIDRNKEMVQAWDKYFKDENHVTIKLGNILDEKVDAIVSPANSFGDMKGGLDRAICDKLGWDLETRVQDKIQHLPEKELLVGKAIITKTNNEDIPYLISAPTIRKPRTYFDFGSVNAYLAMKAIMIEFSTSLDIQSIALTGLCTGVLRMSYEESAKQMYQAYREIIKDAN